MPSMAYFFNLFQSFSIQNREMKMKRTMISWNLKQKMWMLIPCAFQTKAAPMSCKAPLSSIVFYCAQALVGSEVLRAIW